MSATFALLAVRRAATRFGARGAACRPDIRNAARTCANRAST